MSTASVYEVCLRALPAGTMRTLPKVSLVWFFCAPFFQTGSLPNSGFGLNRYPLMQQFPIRLRGGSASIEQDIPPDAPAGCPGPSSEEAGKTASCQGCPNQAVCSSGTGSDLDPDKLAAKIRMEGIRYKLLVLSGKGGVGKSTLATQLAMALSQHGDLTGLLDIDICGPSIPRMVGVEGEEVRQVFSCVCTALSKIWP